MHGAGHFAADFGLGAFLVTIAFAFLVNSLLERFVESERIQKVFLFVIVLLFVAVMVYFDVFAFTKNG